MINIRYQKVNEAHPAILANRLNFAGILCPSHPSKFLFTQFFQQLGNWHGSGINHVGQAVWGDQALVGEQKEPLIMENAQLIALSRQSALRNQLNVVANNMANINTGGFKAQRLLFEEYVMPVAEATEFNRRDHDLFYVQDYGTRTEFMPGSIKLTGNELDIAIEGDGFFVIQTADGGEAYTRNGAFTLDEAGQLVTPDDKPVLTEGGPINFTTADGKIDISRDGTISTELGVRGRIRVVNFDNPQNLVQMGDNLFQGENAIPNAKVRVTQGAIEQSNVEGVVEVTRLIEITRAYTTVSKMIKDADELRQKAISTLGRLEA